jgi:hypothetical protein
LIALPQVQSVDASPNPSAVATNSREAVLDLAFLSEMAAWDNKPTSPESRVVLARMLHVQPEDVAVITAAARNYQADEESLREEALAYKAAQAKANLVRDPVVVRSFARRRFDLAQSSVASLQTKMPAESFAGLRKYITGALGQHVTVWR